MHWINTTPRLQQFLKPLGDGGLLALDTEFLRTDTYYPKLCLIQLARQDGEIALIDPLRCDLSPLWACLRNPAVTVIIHAAFQDLEVLYQSGGVLPARLVDTQLVALLHGYGDQMGLSALLQKQLGIDLDKSATRSNWCQRPLTQQQIHYAAEDVRHLIPLYQALWQPLSPAARAALQQDFHHLLDTAHYQHPIDTAWQRLPGSDRLSAKQQTLLRRLAAWREQTAQQENRPRRWIIGDDALMALAKRPPADQHKLKNVPGLSAPQIRQYGAAILAVIDAAFHSRQWEKHTSERLKPSASELPLLTLAQAVVRQQSLDFAFNPNTITKHTLLQWLRHRCGELSYGWRHLLLGAPLQRIQQGTPLIWKNKLEIPYETLFTP